jgi:hypothetical protein
MAGGGSSDQHSLLLFAACWAYFKSKFASPPPQIDRGGRDGSNAADLAQFRLRTAKISTKNPTGFVGDLVAREREEKRLGFLRLSPFFFSFSDFLTPFW